VGYDEERLPHALEGEKAMRQVAIEEAGSQLAALVREAQNGEEAILMQNNAPVARLTRVEWEPPHPQFGSAKEVIVWMADDFPAPLEDFAEYM